MKEKNSRIGVVALVFFVIIGIIVGKLFYVQILHGAEMKSAALSLRLKEIEVLPDRGMIYDRSGSAMAISIETYSVYITPSNVRDAKKRAEIVQSLSDILEIPLETIEDKVNSRSGFEWIKRHATDEQAAILQEKDFRGVGMISEYQRSYPKGRMASHIIGFAGLDNQGLGGIELRYDKELRGIAGRLVVEQDNYNNTIPQAVRESVPAVPGADLYLTIDETIQYITERELEKIVAAESADAASAIVMDVNTGEILAMANLPDFDPNQYGEVDPKVWNNYCVSGSYEPGSTFKIISSAMFLEEDATKVDDHYYCKGYEMINGHALKCWRHYHPHGDQTFRQGVANSCNPVMAQVVAKMGKEAFYDYLAGFGMTAPTGIDLAGEATGIIVPEESCIALDLAAMSIGQSNAFTPIQMITAISAVANGGFLMEPQIVDLIVSREGEILKDPEPKVVRRVISEETSIKMRDILEYGVTNGTAAPGAVEGYRVAGKTGTAEVVDRTGGYSKSHFIVSFAGFAPADNPKVACLVIVDNPKKNAYGGLTAGPVFASIVDEVLRYYDVPKADVLVNNPHDVRMVAVPELPQMSRSEGLAAIGEAGLSPSIVTEGNTLYGYLPVGGSIVPEGTRIKLYLADEGAEEILLPDLRGHTIKEVDRILSGFGLTMSINGSGLAERMSPEPGTAVSAGGNVTVWFVNTEEKAKLQEIAQEMDEQLGEPSASKAADS